MPESTASASFGPMPLIGDQPLEDRELERRGEAEERELILAHVRVHAQRDLGAGIAGGVERRQRHRDVVADAADVDDHAVGMLLEHAPAKKRDHAGRRPVAGRQLLTGGAVRPALGRAASTGDGLAALMQVTDRHRQRIGGVVRRRARGRARAAA